MISRRDKLLVRPWEQRRYENHRRKVQSASPAIDVGPPANRIHVFCKLKKQQKESERCDKIEKDNLMLLQKMRSLMSTTRVDNAWRIAQPNFLNRVTMYEPASKQIYKRKDSPQLFDEKTRKSRCYACTPKKIPGLKIPEDRIPWAPPKPQVARKRSQSLPDIPKIVTSPIETPESTEIKMPKPKRKSRNRKLPKETSTAQSIVLSRGSLHLAVNFPVDTLVKLKDGGTEKFLIPGPCQCKSIRS